MLWGGLINGDSTHCIDVLESLLRLLGAMAEFNDTNQQAARWEMDRRME